MYCMYQGLDDTEMEEKIYIPKDDNEKGSIASLNFLLLLNLALCFQHTSEWSVSIDACNAVLDIDAKCAKALYRRAMVSL